MQDNPENAENITQPEAQKPQSPHFQASELNAAAEAAAFVASIFAEDDAPSAQAEPQATAADGSGADDQQASAEAAAPQTVPPNWPAPEHAAFLRGRRVLVLGLGASGLAMAAWCARLGAMVVVADSRANPPQRQTLAARVPQAQFVHSAELGPQLLDGVPEAENSQHNQNTGELPPISAIYRSPGLAPAQTAALEAAARARGLVVGGELDLFARALADLRTQFGHAPRVLAITGTNGKTTTTSLVTHLLQHAGVEAVAAGNIGPTLLDTLAQRLDAAALPAVWVLELSSFQLHNSRWGEIYPAHAAAVLNVSEDHLDWHADMAEYAQAKARIFGPGTLAVLNRDDATVAAMQAVLPKPQPSAPTQAVSKKAPPTPAPLWTSFGTDTPAQPGHWGLEELGGMTWLVRAHPVETAQTRASRNASNVASVEPTPIQRLMPTQALRIHGLHNAMNALAALALAHSAGPALADLLHGLRTYAGEPHRVQSVAIVDGVEFFDDSKGTNVGATLAALNGLGPTLGESARIVLIAGGLGKGQDFSPLAAAVARFVRAVVLIGQDAPQIAQALQATRVSVEHAASMEEAVTLAAQRAHACDAVLLSPACASMDMFRDYAHRAEVFVAAVQNLAFE